MQLYLCLIDLKNKSDVGEPLIRVDVRQHLSGDGEVPKVAAGARSVCPTNGIVQQAKSK